MGRPAELGNSKQAVKYVRVDTFDINGPMRLTPEGYLHFNMRCARVGDLRYYGPTGWRTEHVSAEELSREDSLKSITFKPVADDHPPGRQLITSRNVKEFVNGWSKGEAAFDGEFVVVGGFIYDPEIVGRIQREDSKIQISLGYILEDLVKAPEGAPYDFIQKGRIANHIALTESPRGGPDLEIIRADSTCADNIDIAFYREDSEELMNEDFKKMQEEIRARLDSIQEEMKKNDEEGGETPTMPSSPEGEMAAKLEGIMAAINSLMEQLQSRADEVEEKLKKDESDEDNQRNDSANQEQLFLSWFNERQEIQQTAARFDSLSDNASTMSSADLKKAIVAAHFGEERLDSASDAEVEGLYVAAREITREREKARNESLGAATSNTRLDSAGVSREQEAIKSHRAQYFGKWGNTANA